MQLYWLLLGVLGVWRVTHLLSSEDGPWEIVVRIRRRAGEGFLGQLLDCFYCLSLWIAAPFAWLIGSTSKERFCLWLALSGGAILLQRFVPDAQAPMPLFLEHGEQDNVMLRQTENSGSTIPDNPGSKD